MTSKEMKWMADTLRRRFSEWYREITIGDRACFKLEDGRIIFLGCLPSYGAFVVEYADNADEAGLNRFEDGDLFYPEDMSLEEIFAAMRREIESAVLEEGFAHERKPHQGNR